MNVTIRLGTLIKMVIKVENLFITETKAFWFLDKKVGSLKE